MVLILMAAACTSGSSDECADGETACEGLCVDTSSHPEHCGACGVACDTAGGEQCIDGECIGPPECNPGDTEPCYDGPDGSEGVGPCAGGTRRCLDNSRWSTACEGQVLPGGEICGNGVDENCNGTIDEDTDVDGDGWTTCGGDCCDSTGDGCDRPKLVNPGAFDLAGNELDDDCDGQLDNQPSGMCDGGLATSPADPIAYAKAIGLCQTATQASRKWGVISARLSLASGSGVPAAASHAIRSDFGGTSVQQGSRMVVLSTGHAADLDDTSPTFVKFQTGALNGTSSAIPADWLQAHGGNLPNAPGCAAPASGTANDPVMLTLKIRTPTNARSFSLSTNFFSAEYPEYVCSPFNDFFVTLLDSAWDGDPANPVDKNLASYDSGSGLYPVGVNLAYGNTGLFRQCKNGPTGCAWDHPGTTTSCEGIGELLGTGFDDVKPPSAHGPHSPGWCGSSDLAGGGTGWLKTRGNVAGGEVITVRFAIWDTSDEFYDSVVLLDNFRWSVEAAQPGTDVE